MIFTEAIACLASKTAFDLASLLPPAGCVVNAARQREEAELGISRGTQRRPRLLRQRKWKIPRCVRAHICGHLLADTFFAHLSQLLG